jgi:hypothetical protein
MSANTNEEGRVGYSYDTHRSRGPVSALQQQLQG